MSTLPLHLSAEIVKPSGPMFHLGVALSALMSLCGLLPPSSARPAAPEDSVTLEQVSYDLYKSAQSGHIHQVGPTISPNAPGWEYLTRKGLGQWRAPTQSSSGRWVSFIEGRGAHIDFPITEEDRGLEELSIWLEPATSRQILSLFLDEQLISNLSLNRRPKLYRLKLPKTLEAGEHRLRLWFRSSRVAPWGGRTAGAVGPIQFTPTGTPHTTPIRWTGDELVDQQRWGALYAPPPTSWRFYLAPPLNATLELGAWVGDGPATRFEVRAARDGESEVLLHAVELAAREHKLLKIPLSDYAHTPLRLTLSATPLTAPDQAKQTGRPKPKQKRAKEAHMQVGWLSPKITGHHPSPRSLSPVKVVIMWVIDGLNQDSLALIRERAAELPTLSALLKQGYQLPSLWSGVNEPSLAHKALLQPHEGVTLPALLNKGQVTSSLITLDEPLEPSLMRSFHHIYEVTQEGAAGHIEGLKHLEDHLSAELDSGSPEGRHFIYLSSSELSLKARIKHGFNLTRREGDERDKRKALNQLALLDYQLMMVMSELGALELLSQSMLLLVGTPSPHAYLADRGKLSNAERALKSLEVSALLWHPRHLDAQFSLQGGHLSALSATIAQTLMGGEPSDLPYDSLSAHLLSHIQLPPQALRAVLGPSTVTRLGEYLLYEHINRPPLLRERREGRDSELTGAHPITLRTLKDALSSARLGEGL